MVFVHLFSLYIFWHYTKAWRDIFRIIGNYVWFVSNYFSIRLLWRTLFDPWRRMAIVGGKGTGDSVVGAILVNTFMRGVGFLMRSITIFVGSLALLLTILCSCFLVFLWVTLPLVVFFLFFAGIGQILQNIF